MEQSDEQFSSVSKPNCVCICLVCQILQKGFSRYQFHEKMDIISSGRQTPVIHLETQVKQSTKKFTRHFKADCYAKYKWLTGCGTRAKLFCWPCILFNTSEKIPWNSIGFSDLNNFHKDVKRHINSRGHLTALIRQKTFGKTNIERNLDQLKLDHKLHNELVAKNRDVLKRLIDLTCFLGKHELSFRHDKESTNQGNCSYLIELLMRHDETLKKHLKDSNLSSDFFQGTSNRIQNDLIKCIADTVLDSIKNEIKDASFLSIMLSETSDINNFSQLAVVVRYIKSNGTIQERFLGFLEVTTDRTAATMYKFVCDIIEELKCSSKLVAQCYDGAAVMADQLGDLQIKVKEKFKNASFLHCFAHRLNLVALQSVRHVKDCKMFFLMLHAMAAFFSKSAKRARVLDVQIQKIFPTLASTGWYDSGQLVQTVMQNRMTLIELFEDILDKQDEWDFETVFFSKGYSQLLQNDFNFNFLLNVFSEIFLQSNLLFGILQTKSNDIDDCVENIKIFEKKLSQKRDQFTYFWEKSMNSNLEPETKRINVENMDEIETSYHQLYLEIVDNIIQHLRVRFKNYSELKFIELCNFKNYSNSNFPAEALNSLTQSYGNFFDIAALRSQLNVVYSTPEINNQETPLNMLLFLKETGLEESYSEVFNLCQLVLTIPTIRSSVECTFSTLKRIKNFVRNSKGEENVSNLAVLSIEKECLTNLSQDPRFYEDVIYRFACVDKRIKLHYK